MRETRVTVILIFYLRTFCIYIYIYIYIYILKFRNLVGNCVQSYPSLNNAFMSEISLRKEYREQPGQEHRQGRLLDLEPVSPF